MNKIQNNDANKVEIFFDRYAYDFDSIYGSLKKRNFFTKQIDNLFRQSMFNRYKLTIDFFSKENNITSCLDIGTGPGRYCIDIAKLNIKNIGIDVSSEMIKIANSNIPSNLKNLIEFKCIDYMDYIPDQKIDVSILMGFFDYIKDPIDVFLKLKKDTNKYILASFPKLYEPLSIQRYVRYTLTKCPLYLYSKKRIVKIMRRAEIYNFKIINNKRVYFLIAKLI